MVYGQLGPGTTIADRYELVQLLGEGGMGEVWKARHKRLDSFVAIKFVRDEGSDRDRFHDRFEREAQLAASVKHRNVVTIMDYGETPQGLAYMVMDYLDGEPLTAYVRRAFAVEDVVHIVMMALRGLAAVHQAGIVHRDLKPDNIFLVHDGSGAYPKLLDFGISRQTDHTHGKRSAVTTQHGVLLGTPAYMSPEQARGLRDIDLRTDIYSMGVLLYEALAGQLPFDAEHVGDLMVQVISARPKHLRELCPTLPAALCDAVMKSIAREREERFQTAEQMRLALLAAMEGNRSLLRSERPTAAPVHAQDSAETLITDSMQEPFQSMIQAPKAASSDPARTLQSSDSLGPVASAIGAQQTLDGTSVDIVISSGQRRAWLIGAAIAALTLIAAGVLVFGKDDAPSDVVATPLEGDVQIEAATPAAALPPEAPNAPEAPNVVMPPAVEEPSTQTSANTEPADAGAVALPTEVAPPSSAASTPGATIKRTNRVERAPNRPPSKTKSKVLTELDY